ncbi:MAG TPA: TonB-dependent receptor [Steroidobacteraceae bacterium]|jgi:iron complex outermembrane receptor protein|nr:TonB-dependent receptor [Steroidobacteraceae bacterium]
MRNAILTGLLCAASTAAIAQNAATAGPTAPDSSAAASESSTQLQAVVVTGTLIRGEAAPIGSQLTTLGSAQIVNTGTTNTADLLATMPMLNSFNIAPQGGQSEFNSGGSSTPGMHGLPGTATLVLIDGHRAVGDTPLLTVPDPSSIPPGAIDHVEVLADGGSAIYGSDAVAGVINIILKDHFNGAQTNVSYGEANPYNTLDFNQTFGKTWHGGSFLFSGAYESNSDLQNRSRSFYQYAPAGLQYVPNYNCSPPNVEVGSQTYSGSPLTPGPLTQCDPNAYADMYNQNRRYSFITTVRQDLGSRVRLSFDGKYTDQLTKEQTPTVAVATGHDAAGRPIISVPNTNPYFVQPPGSAATSENVLMSTSSLGTLYDQFRSRSGMANLGALIRLGGDWDLNANLDYSWSSSSTLNPDNGGVNLTYLAAAVNGTSPGTALNPFGPTDPQVAANILDNPLWFYGDQKLLGLDLQSNGTIFTVPGGPVKLAVGATARQEKYSGSNPIGVAGMPGYNDNFVDAKRKIYSADAELAVPIIGSSNSVAGVKRLDVSVAARYSHYSDFGGTTNPKYGLNWVPFDGLKLRASYGTSFHAPQLADVYGIDTRAGGGGPGSPPPGYTLPPGTPYTTAYIAGGRSGLQPETAKNASFGFDWKPQAMPGFSASLTYFLVRFTNEVQIPPPGELFLVPALESRFAYINPTGNPADPLAPLTPAQIAQALNGVRLTGLLATTPFPPLYQIIDLRRANIGATSVDGWDFDFGWRHPVPNGQIMLGLSGEWLTEFETNSGPGTPWADNLVNGNSYQTSDTSAYNVIPWHVRGTIGWQAGAEFMTQANLNYTGHYNFGYVSSAGEHNIQQVGSFFTVDWEAQYFFPDSNKYTQGLSAQLNIYNLLSQAPPLVMVANGFSQESANPLGRFFRLSLSKRW